MLLIKAEPLVLSLVEFHGHTDWRVQFNRRNNEFGATNYATKTLSFSVPLIQANDEHELIDTVLHEIAHIRAGAGAGHGPEWAAIARELGADPTWKNRDTKSAEGRYQAICPCGQIMHKYRRPKYSRYSHKGCGGSYQYIDTQTMTMVG